MANREVRVRVSAQDNFSPTMDTYNRKMGQAAQATKQTDTANKSLLGSFQGLQTAVVGTMAAFGVQQVISFAEGMNELGTQVHANRALFDQLTSSIGGNEAVMASLRNATGGVVDDMTLMSGASQLLRLNIVDNNRDLSDLVSNIQKLKQPTESTTDAIQNFALMLSNESLLRLDSFGISSANVKKRMDELGESFREAVMFEMDNQVERLGDAADVAETSLHRLQTRIENIVQVLAEGFAGNVEATLQAFEGTNPEQQGREIADRMGVNVSDFGTYAQYEDFLIHAVAYQKFLRDGIYGTVDALRSFIDAQQDSIDKQQRSAELLSEYQSHGYDIMFDPSRIERGMFDLQNQQSGYFDGTRLFTQQEAAAAQAIADNAQAMVDNISLLQPYIDGGIVSQDDVDHMKDVAKGAQDFANEVQKGADTLDRMKLSDFLGQTGGGVTGEIGDAVIAAAQANGMGDTQLAALQNAFDMGSGRETAASQEFQNDVVAAILGLPTPDQMVLAAQNYAMSMRLAAEQGISNPQMTGNMTTFAGIFGGQLLPGFDPTSYMASYSGMLNSGDARPGAGVSVGDAMADIETKTLNTEGHAKGIADNFEDAKGHVTDMAAELAEMFDRTYVFRLDAIAPDWLKALLTGAGGIAFAAAMATATVANGGTPPGQQAQGRSQRPIQVP